MDYLLRDSHYCGVEYGTYDLDKLIHSLRVIEFDGNYVLGINQSGIQAVEEFVLARYWMFIQVYFHKDRRLFDYYLSSFMKEYLTLEVDKTGKYPVDLKYYLELDDSEIDCAIQKYAKCHPDKDTKRIHYFADRLFSRKHHKVAFNPPYVHYSSENRTEQDAYKRIFFVQRNIKKKLKDFDELCVYVDLAAGSATKHSFNIKVFNEEQSPDMQMESTSDQRLPAIPVVSKHSEKGVPIQDYSFTLRSISDRKIGILRVYAEEGIVDEIRDKCQSLFTEEYEEYRNRAANLEKEVEEDKRKLKEKQEMLNAMKEDLS